MEPIIIIEELSYSYPDGTQALRNVSLNVFPGEKVGIIGANGAGKSTLILHLNGLFLTDGKVEIGGTPVSRKTVKEIRRRVGLVFQNPDDQLFCPTLYDDVAFGPRNMGIGEEKMAGIVEQTLAKVGLDGKGNRGSFHLSFGEKRRASLATVLSMSPEILVFDEPTSGLDPRGRTEIIKLLDSIGGTQIIVSHDLTNLKRMVERVVLMAEGEVIADGSVEEILSDEELLRRAKMV